MLLVAHAEALLFVNDYQAEVMGVNVTGEQAVGAHQHLYLAFRKALKGRCLLSGRTEAGKHLN